MSPLRGAPMSLRLCWFETSSAFCQNEDARVIRFFPTWIAQMHLLRFVLVGLLNAPGLQVLGLRPISARNPAFPEVGLPHLERLDLYQCRSRDFSPEAPRSSASHVFDGTLVRACCLANRRGNLKVMKGGPVLNSGMGELLVLWSEA